MFAHEELGVIRTIITGYEGPGGLIVPIEQMVCFLVVWYFFMSTTYGVWVPAGLFLPGIIVGCAIGAIYSDLQQMLFPNHEWSYTSLVLPVLLAIGGMLSAYSRMTYSLAVVMMETTASINIFMPMFLAIMVSRVVANSF